MQITVFERTSWLERLEWGSPLPNLKSFGKKGVSKDKLKNVISVEWLRIQALEFDCLVTKPAF